MSDYVVAGQTYTFPDTYSDEQARDILVRHGVIKLQGGGGIPPGPAKPPAAPMETTTAGKILPAVRSFAAGSLKGIENLPSTIAAMRPGGTDLPPIPPSVEPWHPSTYSAYQPPNPQAGLQHGIQEFQQDPFGTAGQMIPLAAMGAAVDVPPTGAALAPTPKTGAPNLPEVGPIGRAVAHLVPGGRTALRIYDAIKSIIPSAGEETPPPTPKTATNIPPVAESTSTLPPAHQALADEIVKTSMFTTLTKPEFMTKVKNALQEKGAAHFTPEELQSIYDHIDSRVVARKH